MSFKCHLTAATKNKKKFLQILSNKGFLFFFRTGFNLQWDFLLMEFTYYLQQL